MRKRYGHLPVGLVVAGLSLWGSSTMASPAFLASPSLSNLSSGLGSLSGMVVMALAEEGRADHEEHDRRERPEARHEHGRAESRTDHPKPGMEHSARRPRRPEQDWRPEPRGDRSEPQAERSRSQAVPGRGPRPAVEPPRAPSMGHRPSSGGPTAPMMRGPMGPGPRMGPPWMRGQAGRSPSMGRMPMGPPPGWKPEGRSSEGRRAFDGPPVSRSAGGPPAEAREQMLRRKLMEMEMRIRKLEAEVRQLRADD